MRSLPARFLLGCSSFVVLTAACLPASPSTQSGGGGGAGRQGATGGAGGVGEGGSGLAPMAGSGGAAGGAGSPAMGGGGHGGTAVTGTGGLPFTEPSCVWPTPVSTRALGGTAMRITGLFDGGMVRFTGEGTGQGESNPVVFQLENGATIQNVIIGSPAGDGIHCKGTCTLRNVWWEDVGEDAATLEGGEDAPVMTVDGGGARMAFDKVFQHNGPGTVIIRNFCVQDFGKLYRSCGNCGTQHQRHVVMENVSVTPGPTTASVVGVNQNYGDTAMLRNIVVHAATVPVCLRFQGNDTGAEPLPLSAGPDPVHCLYDPGHVFFVP